MELATAWWPTLLSGFLGSLIGTIGAFGAALFVIKRQARADRQLAADTREAIAVDAALQMAGELNALAFRTAIKPGADAVDTFGMSLLSRWNSIMKTIGGVSDEVSDRMGNAMKELTGSTEDWETKDAATWKAEAGRFANAFGAPDGIIDLLDKRQRELALSWQEKPRRRHKRRQP